MRCQKIGDLKKREGMRITGGIRTVHTTLKNRDVASSNNFCESVNL